MRDDELLRRLSDELPGRLRDADTVVALAEVLDWVRQRRGRTQRQVADRAQGTKGLSRSSVNNLLAGRKPIPGPAVLLPLARYCGVPDDLMGQVRAAWDRVDAAEPARATGDRHRVPEPRAAHDDRSDGGRAAREHHLETLRVMADIAGKLTEEAVLPIARALYEHVLATRRDLLGERNAETLNAAHNLGVVLAELEDFATARRVLQATYQARRDTLGESHPSTLSSMESLATAHCELGEHDAARRLLTTCLDHRRRALTESASGERTQALARYDTTAGKLLVVLHQLDDRRAIERIEASLVSMDDFPAEDAGGHGAGPPGHPGSRPQPPG
ncbi:tetratricopeptide repeat protein [Couchioplanes azureus]|uniref:tetratricopeptide repeat protein n=1 Tax=Couchioplanes caeruleus TaxID=56438 RepID=UPI001671630C|nr:tetratricopeptide repeat protein [Couchioplanes caeruleus]